MGTYLLEDGNIRVVREGDRHSVEKRIKGKWVVKRVVTANEICDLLDGFRVSYLKGIGNRTYWKPINQHA